MNIESVKEFFVKNNVEDDDHIWYSKNFYAVLELLKYDKAYEEVVMQGLYGPRNPNTSQYPIKLGKGMVNNIISRITGAVSSIKDNEKITTEYRQAILIQATMLYKMGYEFKYNEITTLMDVYDFLDAERDKLNLHLEKYDDIYKDIIAQKKYPTTSARAYRNKLEKVLKTISDEESSKNIYFDIINDYDVENHDIIDEFVDLACNSNVCINHKANINLRKIQQMEILKANGVESYEEACQDQEYQESYGVQVADPEQVAEYRKVMRRIYEKSYEEYEKNGKNMAHALYENLNKELVYNTTAFSWSQENEQVKKIINHHESEDINEKRRAVTCHQWAKAYRELLTAAEYDAYVVGKEGHQYVLFFDEEVEPYIADATNPPDWDSPNWFHGSDLTRSKLGLTPNNMFKLVSRCNRMGGRNQFFDNGVLKERYQIIGEQAARKDNIKFNIDDYKKENGKIDFKAVIKVIDENPTIAEKFAKTVWDNHQGEDMVIFMNDILKCLIEGHEDDDLLVATCVSNLVYILAKGEDSLLNTIKEKTGIFPGYSMGYSLDLYKKTEDRTKMVPAIYVKEKDRVDYYVWDEVDGFTNITKQEIIDKINSGEYHCSKNNDSKGPLETRFFIPGIRSPKKDIKEEQEAIFGADKSTVIEDENGWQHIDF